MPEVTYAELYGRIPLWRKVLCALCLAECDACRWWRESGRP